MIIFLILRKKVKKFHLNLSEEEDDLKPKLESMQKRIFFCLECYFFLFPTFSLIDA